MIEVWVPTKFEIEAEIRKALRKLETSDTVSEVAEELDASFSQITCHLHNRALEEEKARD